MSTGQKLMIASPPEPAEPRSRPVGITERTWCRAVPGGTGIVVTAVLTTHPPDICRLENAYHKLQNSHPILRTRLHHHNQNKSSSSSSFHTSPSPFLKVKTVNLVSTLKVLETHQSSPTTISPFHVILEHELNQNTWPSSSENNNDDNISSTHHDVLCASCYALPDEKWAVVLRLHAAACDRTTAVSLMKELEELVRTEDEASLGKHNNDNNNNNNNNKGEVSLGIEDLVPKERGKKSFWSRGVDLVSYSVNSFRLTNLKFIDTTSSLPRSSQVVRLQLNKDQTDTLLAGCKSKGVKLCSVLAGSALIAAQGSRKKAEKQRKYAVATLVDCRPLLDPPLSNHHFGFYHSVILNTHVLKGGEKLWDLAEKMYMAFTNYKNSDRQFTDMADINFLMCKAMENPTLTSSSSLRTSLVSVFEDTVVGNCDDMSKEKDSGVDDFMGCGSVHGPGPSIAMFDTIRGGKLDCVCVYPAPLHSREQMVEFVESVKGLLVDGCNSVVN